MGNVLELAERCITPPPSVHRMVLLSLFHVGDEGIGEERKKIEIDVARLGEQWLLYRV